MLTTEPQEHPATVRQAVADLLRESKTGTDDAPLLGTPLAEHLRGLLQE
jgi:hypothetical protein